MVSKIGIISLLIGMLLVYYNAYLNRSSDLMGLFVPWIVMIIALVIAELSLGPFPSSGEIIEWLREH